MSREGELLLGWEERMSELKLTSLGRGSVSHGRKDSLTTMYSPIMMLFTGTTSLTGNIGK